MSAQSFHSGHVTGDGKAGRGVGVHGADVNGQRAMQNGMNSSDSAQQGFQAQQEAPVRSRATRGTLQDQTVLHTAQGTDGAARKQSLVCRCNHGCNTHKHSR